MTHFHRRLGTESASWPRSLYVLTGKEQESFFNQFAQFCWKASGVVQLVANKSTVFSPILSWIKNSDSSAVLESCHVCVPVTQEGVLLLLMMAGQLK